MTNPINSKTTDTSNKNTAVDQVVIQLRDYIRDQGMMVGDVLPPETDMAKLFGTGRNTVREAVRTLKAYGVLESRQKVGAVITDGRQAAIANLLAVTFDISIDAFHDIQGFRRLTEMNLADKLIGNLDDETLELLEKCTSKMAASSDVAEASAYDFEFHKALVDAAGNQTLSEVYGMLKPIMKKLMEAGKSQRDALDAAEQEHLAIIEALRSASKIDYLYHMNRHLDAGLEFIPSSSD